MDVIMFLTLLFAFSVLTSLVMEFVKKFINDKENISYNMVTVIIAVVIGGIGTLIYYQLTSLPFTLNNIIYAVLMGLSSGLCSMLGYDKVKQTILQIMQKNGNDKA